MSNAKMISPTDAWRTVQSGGAQLLDVREPGEFSSAHAPGAVNAPLSTLEERVADVPAHAATFVICAVGPRAIAAAKILEENGRTSQVVEGGMTAWRRLRLPMDLGERRIWDLDRQVRFCAGILILSGLGLSRFVHPAFIWISGFVGAGLTFSGVTGFCGMAMILARMPWNRH